MSAGVQDFIGLEHGCRSDLEALSQATKFIYGFLTARVHKLAQQQKSLNHHEVSASHSVGFDSA
jgi:hypothetical protein